MRILLSFILVIVAAAPVAAQSAPKRYEAALAREKQVRASDPSPAAIRAVIAQYQAIVRRYPRSGYSDNALWNAAGLHFLALQRHGNDADRREAIRLLEQLRRSYPSGTLAKQVPARVREIKGWTPTRRASAATAKPAGARTTTPAEPEATPTPDAPKARFALVDVTRSALPAGERLTITLDGEPQYVQERLADPDRLFFDFRDTAADSEKMPDLQRLAGGVVRDMRLGTHPERTTRLVLELEPNTRHTVFALQNPYRLVVDLERSADAPPPPAISAAVPPASSPMPAAAPVAPAVNSNGSFSLSRQLGLGVARIVIDPGHGGHDPGASANRVVEKELVLDIALRLEKLLLAQPGIEVVMTRRDDTFIPLEERTAIANREAADLFLSIHANVARNKAASGVETYFLNFSTSPEAEAVAARENAGTGMAMHALPDIVRKIALNNKIDESRDLARVVQASLIRRLRNHNALAKDRGVKQAPFVVLIGAEMPSVLAEIAFLTNRDEATLLRRPAYRQQVAHSLYEAVLKYRESLKKVTAVASSIETR